MDDAGAALAEFMRVCRKNGKIIISTYVNNENAGYENVEYKIVKGKMPCAIVIISREK